MQNAFHKRHLIFLQQIDGKTQDSDNENTLYNKLVQLVKKENMSIECLGETKQGE